MIRERGNGGCKRKIEEVTERERKRRGKKCRKGKGTNKRRRGKQGNDKRRRAGGSERKQRMWEIKKAVIIHK